MYARLVFAEISVYPGTREKVDKVLVNLKRTLDRVDGLNSYTLFNNWDKGEVGVFALWESEGAERSAWEKIKTKMDDARDILWRGRPLFKTFDVYEHGPTSPARTPKKTTRRTATTKKKAVAAKKPSRPRGRPAGSTTRRTAARGTATRRTTTRRRATTA